MAEDVCVDFRVSAVLPAGGTGVRMGLDTPKQFYKIHGRPLISYTLQRFERIVWIQEVIVSVAEDKLGMMSDIIQEFGHQKVELVPGGTTRHRSIWNGVKALKARNPLPSVVIIHDAVRPFVDEQILKSVSIAAKEHGAAGSIRALVSTVVARSEDGFLSHSLDRSKYKASEMPQAFQFDVIYGAYSKCTDNDFEFGTECLHLAQHYGGAKVKLIHGPESLWKVTHVKDLHAARGIIEDEEAPVVVLCSDGQEAEYQNEIRTRLQQRGAQVTCVSVDRMTEGGTIAGILESRLKDLPGGIRKICLIGITHLPHEAVEQDRGCAKWVMEINAIFRLLKCCRSSRDKVMVEVIFTNDEQGPSILKKTLGDISTCGKPHRITCYGVFTKHQQDVEVLAEMTVSAALDMASVFSGQVFSPTR